ncbi:MAG: type II toxin-antitoxin system PemK/MazF family toxin [Nitriliruptoraceae bacterium]
MRRGEVWLADLGRKPRPVLVITRDAVLDVRTNVTVAEVTTQARGLAVEVPIDTDTGIRHPSVINCDGLHTVSQQRLTQRLGSLDGETLDEVCVATALALGCDRD